MPSIVSIIIPCFNNASTLPLAIASVVAQSYKDWECIVVDDGSTDNPAWVVAKFKDSRIRCIRLEENGGRGAARQFGLEAAKGEFLAMVDADDWIYPEKLATQIGILENDPKIALISSPLAISNSNGMVGVRGGIQSDKIYQTSLPTRRTILPLFVHASSMFRMSIVKEWGYNKKLHTAEDGDLLARIIRTNPYGVMRAVTYAYSEYSSASLRKMLQSYFAAIKISWRYRKGRLHIALRDCLLYSLKAPLISAAFISGFGDAIIARRSRRPASHEIMAFNAAKYVVNSIMHKYFPES